MTEPTADPHRHRLDAIAGNAVAPALDALPAPGTGDRWWLPLGVREHIGRAVVQALLDAGAVTIAIVPDGTRKTATTITDSELTSLYDEIDQLDRDISAERLHNDDTCAAVKGRDAAEAAVQRVRDLFAYWVRAFPDNPAAPHIEETVASVLDNRHVYIPGGDGRAWAGCPTFGDPLDTPDPPT